MFILCQSNAIAICKPKHETHPEATAYLLFRKVRGCSINTIRNEAYDIKKFLDFLLLWEVDLLDLDLLVLLQGFTDYLCLLPKNLRSMYSLEWATLTKVQLNHVAMSNNKVIPTVCNELGQLELSGRNEIGKQTINKAVQTVIQYISFLKRRTRKYSQLQLNQIPMKDRVYKGLISGTAGSINVTVFDTSAITREAGLKLETQTIKKLPLDAIFTDGDLNNFFSLINNFQDCLLFNILRYAGLRASEAAGIWIDPTTIPKDIINMDHFDAKEILKNSLRGDIQFFTNFKKNIWVCAVKDRGNSDYRSGYKRSGEYREIPWLFSQDAFLELLLGAVSERQMLMKGIKGDHGFLFVSRDRKAKGKPITGKTVAKKYEIIAQRLLREKGINLSRFSPHTFRHYYATYLLKVLNIQIDDVSRWLGHQSTETTRKIYSHWLPRSNETVLEGRISDILQTFNNSLTDEGEMY